MDLQKGDEVEITGNNGNCRHNLMIGETGLYKGEVNSIGNYMIEQKGHSQWIHPEDMRVIKMSKPKKGAKQKRLRVGKWYSDVHSSKACFKYNGEKKNGYYYGMGTDRYGDWYTESRWRGDREYTLATKEQLQEMMTRTAISKSLYSNRVIKACLETGKPCGITEDYGKYDMATDTLTTGTGLYGMGNTGTAVIYRDGVWAILSGDMLDGYKWYKIKDSGLLFRNLGRSRNKATGIMITGDDWSSKTFRGIESHPSFFVKATTAEVKAAYMKYAKAMGFHKKPIITSAGYAATHRIRKFSKIEIIIRSGDESDLVRLWGKWDKNDVETYCEIYYGNEWGSCADSPTINGFVTDYQKGLILVGENPVLQEYKKDFVIELQRDGVSYIMHPVIGNMNVSDLTRIV